MPIATPSQTVGPYFRLGLDAFNSVDVAPPAMPDRIQVAGVVRDGAGAPISDCVLEVWQADAQGEYASIDGRPNPRATPGWSGFARVPTDEAGRFSFWTIVPGAVAFDATRMQAPHALVLIGMRGLLKFLMTRMYFPGPATGVDPVLTQIAPARRDSLIAKPAGSALLNWDIFVQGAAETVFFDY